MSPPSLPNVSSKYGAPMGRGEYGDAPTGKVRLYRLRLNDGGYDSGGAYWGHGLPLYRAEDEGGDFVRHIRGVNRADAANRLGLTGKLARK